MESSSSSNEAPNAGSPTPPWGPVIAIAVLALVGIGLAFWANRPAPEAHQVPRRGTTASDFVGAKACRECHPGEYAAHDVSGHNRTLRPAASIDLARWLNGREQDDPEQQGVTWTYALKDGALAATRKGADESSQYGLDYALGSGKHAITFVSWDGPDRRSGLEHRLTYFAHTKGLGVTPGQESPNREPGLSPEGFHIPPPVMLDCLSCHATRTTMASPGTIDPSTLIPNVSCERCHGPGRAHVEAAQRSAPPSELVMPLGGHDTAAAEIQSCGRCHRLPSMVPPDSIRTDSKPLTRFPSVGVLQSACYKRSRDGLACTTCHDPHARTSTDAKGYETTCLSCHNGPDRKPCPVNASEGCINCHMPKRDVGHGLRFTEHWIQERPPE